VETFAEGLAETARPSTRAQAALRKENDMAINLVSLVMDFLTPEMIGRFAGALGLADSNKVESALSAGVPGLLAGLSGVAASPGGPQKLVEAARQESGTLGKLADALDGDRQSSIIAGGSQLLGSLLGSRDHNALTEAIGRFAGLGQGNSGSLLGMLAPVVLGTLAQQPGSLNANGMANLLAGQKDNIAAALPTGFGRLLGGTGLLDSLDGAAETASQAARTAGSTVFTGAGRAAAETAPAATRWLWLIPAALIAAGLAYWLNGPAQQAVQQNVASAQNLTVAGVDIGKQTSDSISSLRTTLSGVTDIASAKAALPKLQEVTDQFDKTGGMIGSLSADQRKVLAGLVNPTMPEVNQLFDKVLSIPGVGEVLKPTLDTMKSKLATLTA
jgi:hypothetical protein